MARKKDRTGRTLDELQSAGDRLAGWASDNRVLLFGAAVGILAAAGLYGFVQSLREDARLEASAALALAEQGFREAMGTPAESLLVTEPANPETARKARAEYVERFEAVAEEHAGTAAGALAALRAGALQAALGEREAAIAQWRAAADGLDADEPVRALLVVRAAAAHEEEERWIEAGELYEEASDVVGYPLRYKALADAARCYATGGDPDRALQAFERLQTEAPDERIAEHIEGQLSELKMARSL
ncbi:MAG: hypothetical protein O7G30_16610 [Proteobacteria bacterium]|nr:hypothetical protein [Pseudomonadota bacterium]